MDPFVITLIGFLLLVGAALAAIFWESQRSSRMITEWAGKHSYTILNKKQPLVDLGPFRWENPRGRTFYHVTVRDSQGQEHGGWVCCGAEWLGLFSNKVEVRWDEGQPPQVTSSFWQGEQGVWPPPPRQ